LIYKIVLIDLKLFSFRITFVRVGIYFGLVLAKEHKRESLAIKLLNLPYSGIMLFKKPIKKSGNRRAGKTSLRLKEKWVIKEKIEALRLATYNFHLFIIRF
jgi:hypothetical protein